MPLLDARAPYAPVAAYDVVIYWDERDIPYESEPIGLVHAKADDDWTAELRHNLPPARPQLTSDSANTEPA